MKRDFSETRVLIVDDDEQILKAARMALRGLNAKIDTIKSGKAAVEIVRESRTSYALAILDYQFRNEDGVVLYTGDQIAAKLKRINPDLPIMMLSGDKSDQALKAWLKIGVTNFLYKPIAPEQLRTIVEHAVDKFKRTNTGVEKISFSDEDQEALEKVGMVARSKSMAKVAHDLLKFANTPLSVLIMGETGTGKELAARAIHENSPRSLKSFLAVNCASFSGDDSLMESQLFGYEKGAFTGASQTTRGIFEEANGGTVFLDEVHHLSSKAQAKLLRVIQESKVRRVGGKVEIPVDVKIITASKPDLRALTKKNQFLADLFFRISTLEVTIPPLRERTEDIDPLVIYFSKKIIERDGNYKEISVALIDKLKANIWEGNVRELENLIEKLFILVDKAFIHPSDLPLQYGGAQVQEERKKAGVDEIVKLSDIEERFKKETLTNILKALRIANHNVTRAAEILGEKRSTLSAKMRKLEIIHMDSEAREAMLDGLI